jgi:hypothetical protein
MKKLHPVIYNGCFEDRGSNAGLTTSIYNEERARLLRSNNFSIISKHIKVNFSHQRFALSDFLHTLEGKMLTMHYSETGHRTHSAVDGCYWNFKTCMRCIFRYIFVLAAHKNLFALDKAYKIILRVVLIQFQCPYLDFSNITKSLWTLWITVFLVKQTAAQ